LERNHHTKSTRQWRWWLATVFTLIALYNTKYDVLAINSAHFAYREIITISSSKSTRASHSMMMMMLFMCCAKAWLMVFSLLINWLINLWQNQFVLAHMQIQPRASRSYFEALKLIAHAVWILSLGINWWSLSSKHSREIRRRDRIFIKVRNQCCSIMGKQRAVLAAVLRDLHSQSPLDCKKRAGRAAMKVIYVSFITAKLNLW
jgi:hypothetical protein